MIAPIKRTYTTVKVPPGLDHDQAFIEAVKIARRKAKTPLAMCTWRKVRAWLNTSSGYWIVRLCREQYSTYNRFVIDLGNELIQPDGRRLLVQGFDTDLLGLPAIENIDLSSPAWDMVEQALTPDVQP